MHETAYWYFIDGRLRQHISPPVDPSTTTFITVESEDIGYGKVQVEITPCIEGKYLRSHTITSKPYETPKNFRERIEKDIKKILIEQRQITEWGSRDRKKKRKSTVKRRKK